MKKLFVFILMIASQNIFSQESNNVSIFHRLVIYNSQNEILLVNFKDTDIWVTPGFYQDSVQFIKEGLHRIASNYEVKITDPELRGVFSMRREFSKTTEMSIRNIYSCSVVSGEIKTPESRGDAKWFAIDEAIQTVTYKSIKLFLKQINDDPETIWGGSVNVIRKDGIRDYQILEEFYPLSGK